MDGQLFSTLLSFPSLFPFGFFLLSIRSVLFSFRIRIHGTHLPHSTNFVHTARQYTSVDRYSIFY